MTDPTSSHPAKAGVKMLAGQLRPAFFSVFWLSLITGVIFPVVLFGAGRAMFSAQADGSLLTLRGKVIGSRLIGQSFSRPDDFQARPSAAGAGYDSRTSGGSNLSPTNPIFARDVAQFAAAYRRENGLAPDAAVPIDAVTRSASGLDPHISPANAALQISRVARARGLTDTQVRALVGQYTQDRQLGFLGQPRVSVLELNLALDGKGALHGR